MMTMRPSRFAGIFAVIFAFLSGLSLSAGETLTGLYMLSLSGFMIWITVNTADFEHRQNEILRQIAEEKQARERLVAYFASREKELVGETVPEPVDTKPTMQ